MSNQDVKVLKFMIGGHDLIMHNGRLADPLDPYTKALAEVAKKRGAKSDDEHEEIGRREFQGGLWFDDIGDLGPVVPGEALQKVVQDGAKARKLGKKFAATVRVRDEHYKLEYEGPRKRDTLWADARFRFRKCVGQNGNRIVRTRPRFRDWRLTFYVMVLPGGPNASEVEHAIEYAGTYLGLGDWRPSAPRSGGGHGTFSILSWEEVKQPTKKKAA